MVAVDEVEEGEQGEPREEVPEDLQEWCGALDNEERRSKSSTECEVIEMNRRTVFRKWMRRCWNVFVKR